MGLVHCLKNPIQKAAVSLTIMFIFFNIKFSYCCIFLVKKHPQVLVSWRYTLYNETNQKRALTSKVEQSQQLSSLRTLIKYKVCCVLQKNYKITKKKNFLPKPPPLPCIFLCLFQALILWILRVT